MIRASEMSVYYCPSMYNPKLNCFIASEKGNPKILDHYPGTWLVTWNQPCRLSNLTKDHAFCTERIIIMSAITSLFTLALFVC